MANGIDRLERLFRKRPLVAGASTASGRSQSVAGPSTRSSDVFIPKFPEPSFRRPTSTRMIARDEFTRAPRMTWRSQSLPGPENAEDVSMTGSSNHDSLSPDSARTYLPRLAYRSSSILDSHDFSLDSLATFQFREGNGRSQEIDEIGPTARLSRDPPPRLHLRLDALQDLEPIFLLSGIDTPPPSDQDEQKRSTIATDASTPELLPPSDLTPEPSPELGPVEDSQLSDPWYAHELDLKPLLKRDSSDKILARSRTLPHYRQRFLGGGHSVTTKSSDVVLKEPNVGEFFGLKDEDIAEARPSTPATIHVVERTRREPITPPAPSPTRSMKSLRKRAAPSKPPSFKVPPVPALTATSSTIATPPLSRAVSKASTASMAQQGAAIAAFQTASIARKYKFDLVYVANLWPKRMAIVQSEASWHAELLPTTPTLSQPTERSLSSTPSFPADAGSPASMEPGSALNARFLAAYGLATVKPFDLSQSTHLGVLNTEGWLERRDSEPQEGGFTRGYGCSFYTSHVPLASGQASDELDANSEMENTPSRTSIQPRRSDELISDPATKNRGFVFMAYRRSNADDCDGNDDVHLEQLHSEAKVLVDFITDCHTAQRRQEQLASRRATQNLDDPLEALAESPLLPFPRTLA